MISVRRLGALPVADTTVPPAGAIGRLTFSQRGSSFFCTAFLISADTVATAGHCVHDGLAGATDGQSGSTVLQLRRCRGAAGACVVAAHGYGVHGLPPHNSRNHGVTVSAAVAGEFHAVIEVP